ncbi:MULTISPECIES: helix-turn-helix domain-containing GNAT family N-acetyltransferase [Rhodomicrobium]|uniref:bifunctional helix-turn-helix transcriptional regulator/GNAT family N-acetyltransferase n=1 Tax=Rhodomicrobium TaxID=1068 RepID=UPI000B4ACD70|nr:MULTISPECIES: helix-turn-helix domain-containing GNAT family N-acetyltransferase [Rhodomicrobium]
MQTQSLTAAAGALRHFNRFYTAQIGVLDRDLLGSGRSLSEARVLYELATQQGLTAGDLVKSLGLDAGYLSRMLAGFEKDALVERQRSAQDGRVSHLVLTAKGRAAFAALDGLSQKAAEGLVARLPGESRAELLGALGRVEAMLRPEQQAAEVSLRPHRVGDMGWIVHRQALLYARDYGWNGDYEALILDITSKFLREFKPEREMCRVAERGGEIVGSVFVVEASEQVAKLRLLYVEPSARGAGLGRRLVDECIGFAREKGYGRLELWTQESLGAARRIYAEAGFRHIASTPHHSFGHDLVGETWALDLQAAN